MTNFNILDTINDVVQIQKQKADSQGISLEVHVDNIGHKEGLHNPIILHDENRIKQVLLNLQSNAIKFTQKGKVMIKAKIVTNLELGNTMINDNELFLKISVEDTGKGIKKEDQNKLFKLFGYVDDAQGLNTHGIGLGLVISQKIINQFDGQIFMKSEHGIGSEFTFILHINSN